MSNEVVRYSVSDGVAEIMLDRPPVNALNMPLIDALLTNLEKARDDAAVRAVIIGSVHKVFCAGCTSCTCRGWSASTGRSVRCFWESTSTPKLHIGWAS